MYELFFRKKKKIQFLLYGIHTNITGNIVNLSCDFHEAVNIKPYNFHWSCVNIKSVLNCCPSGRWWPVGRTPNLNHSNEQRVSINSNNNKIMLIENTDLLSSRLWAQKMSRYANKLFQIYFCYTCWIFLLWM